MGSTSAMESINRVLEKHSVELKQELHERYPSKLIRDFSLENNLYVQPDSRTLQFRLFYPYVTHALHRRFIRPDRRPDHRLRSR